MTAGLKSFGAKLSVFAALVGGGYAAELPHYLITNNDYSAGNSATFYSMAANGNLREVAVVPTGGTGIDGIGAVATKRVSVVDKIDHACVFISDAGSEDVAGIGIAQRRSARAFEASANDNASFGLGIVQNGRYLYANFTGSKTIATYRMERDCRLSFLGDTPAAGLAGFAIIDMAVHENILVASFFDGSIDSFDISGGQPIANGDLQYSTAHTQFSSGPGAVDITADGHYAIFGDGGTPGMVEVSDLSSGKLQPTVVYQNVGPGDGSAGIWLSPNERLLYIANFSSREITAARFDRFDRLTGTVSAGCSTELRGLNNFEGGLATALPWGSGRTLYVAEPEVEIGIVHVRAEGDSCRLEETPQSPTHDFHTITLESIGVFPPRRF